MEDGDSSGLDRASVFVCASTSSLPAWGGLSDGSDSDERLWEKVSFVTGELDWRKRLYSTGVYLSRLDLSLLGGGLLDLNVLGWLGIDR